MNDPGHTSDLDIEQPGALLAYLRSQRLLHPTEAAETEILRGGVSSRVVRVTRALGASLVVKQALAQLRVADQWFSDPTRVHREALALRWLQRLAPPDTTTPLLFEDFSHHVIGMGDVPRPHHDWKTCLLTAPPDPRHVGQFATILATIHVRAAERRDELEPVFADRSFFESLRIDPYYRCAAERVPAAAPFLTGLIDETAAHAVTLVHGDYSPKNILIHDHRLFLLDHEVMHWGDPAFDLGFSLAHLLSKAHHCEDGRNALLSAAHDYVADYMALVEHTPVGRDLAARAGRHTLGCLLARVAGRSRLEYLTPLEQARQQAIVVDLMRERPADVTAVVTRVGEALSCP